MCNCEECATGDEAPRTLNVEYVPGCHRVERDGLVIGRYITDGCGRISWHVVYAAAGLDATLDTLLDAIAMSR
jgi:hypothetical protein